MGMNFSDCRYKLILKFYLYILLCSLDEITCDVVYYNLVVFHCNLILQVYECSAI